MRKSFWVVVVFCLVLGAVLGGNLDRGLQFANKAAAQPETGVTVGRTIPVFSASGLDGGSVQIGDPGKPYVINFWASWCPPCREELPELNQFAGKHAGDVQFYAINIQEPAERVANFLSSNGYTLPVLLDKDGSAAETFRVHSIPTTIVVDSQGVIRYRKTGGVTMDELESVINSL